jgi:hypothetical protein
MLLVGAALLWLVWRGGAGPAARPARRSPFDAR